MRINSDRLKLSSVIISVTVMLYISVMFILAKPVNSKNTTLIIGHYHKLDKEVNRGDTSYDLYIRESTSYYKISADNSDCFNYDQFQSSINDDQEIKIYLQDSFWRKESAVSIISNNQEYLSFDCSNQEIEKERYQIPFMTLIITLLFIGIIYKKKIEAQLKS